MEHTSNGHKAARERFQRQETASCGGCDQRWSGTSACHCATCHHTFTGARTFDQHHRGGRCHNPANIGLIRNERGRWAQQPMSDADKQRRFGDTRP